jgi:hypothetical protein
MVKSHGSVAKPDKSRERLFASATWPQSLHGYRQPALSLARMASPAAARYPDRMVLRTVIATRYVTPLHEGGSLPAIVEASDDGMYVLKFRGAGQGPKALIAELLGGELARAAQLPIPEIVFIELDEVLARTEPDPEIQSLIKASSGLNLALDYLPGSIMFDPVTVKPDPTLASRIVWLDAFITNVDRTARNTNMLMWHRKLRLIDHGAAFYFHHAWDANWLDRSRDRFPMIKDHVLLPLASEIEAADEFMARHLTAEVIRGIVDQLPDAWLLTDAPFEDRRHHREAYLQYLQRRLEHRHLFVEEALRARSLLV